MKIYPDGVEWNDGTYYFYWWNWLDPDVRYIGFKQYYYDGPISTLGLWFINMSWCTRWTRYKSDDEGRGLYD